MTAEKNGNTHHGPVFGDHATFIMGDGNGVGGRNDPAAPTRTGRWTQHGKTVVGLATVVGTAFTVAAFWVALKSQDSPKAETSKVVAPPATTAATQQPPSPQPTSDPPGGIAPVEAAAGTEFSDVVTIDFGTGYDLDGGKARKQYKLDADTDMSVSSYSLSSSARHSAMHSDTSAGDESGAYGRCRTYRLSGRPTMPGALIYPGAQYCFTSSENHPGWFQVVNQRDNAFIIKVVIWSETADQ
ncbi:hypothetical protein AB0M36_35485 [Actinoplanes sp. NPDC051346]|uniref:hypothetical protein n=1 Tax=Actinoplanes sp. NPDC051346 TaxID=3155048 RepID=UPI0034374B71